MNSFERTLSIIKPDAVERKLENEIKNCFINDNRSGQPKRFDLNPKE